MKQGLIFNRKGIEIRVNRIQVEGTIFGQIKEKHGLYQNITEEE